MTCSRPVGRELIIPVTGVKLVGRTVLSHGHVSFSDLCSGKAMMAYTMPQQRKKKERSERLRGERGQIKFTDLGLERWQVVRFRKARGRQEVP